MHHEYYSGGDPSNLAVTLTGNSIVRVSWTEPDGPPSGGYRIIDAGNSLDRPAPSSPQEFMLTPNDYNIQVTYNSRHLPGGMVGPRTITVLGKGLHIFSIVKFIMIVYVPRCPGTKDFSVSYHCHLSHCILESASIQLPCG